MTYNIFDETVKEHALLDLISVMDLSDAEIIYVRKWLDELLLEE